MDIIYNKNPLYTTVILTEQEQREFWLKIKITEMEELLFEAHFYSDDTQDCFSIDRVKKAVDPDYYMAENRHEKSKLDKRCDHLLEVFLQDLQGCHVGDCTCVPCSCMKCYAESILGIDTIPGLRKHQANKINSAFGKDNERSIDDAIEYLVNFDPTLKNEGYEEHFPRWIAEASEAYDWLVKYRDGHFSKP